MSDHKKLGGVVTLIAVLPFHFQQFVFDFQPGSHSQLDKWRRGNKYPKVGRDE